MELKVLSLDKSNATFILKEINPAIANTIRRIIIDEVPTLAIEDVNIIKNSSALYDETIAHRLGLIPLKTDKSYDFRSECKCKGEGCARCQLNLILKVKGPATVYAEDLKSQDPKIKPIYPKTPIVKLLKDQEVELEATAILGKGKDHIKFSPGLIYYKGYPEIKITKECNECQDCIKQCPPKILKLAEKKIEVTEPVLCILCKACEEACKKDAIKVKGSDTDFIFYLESFGQLSPKDILVTATDIFEEKLKELEKAVDKLKI